MMPILIPGYIAAATAPVEVRDRLIVELMTTDAACPLCGDQMVIGGPLPTRPRLFGPITSPSLACWDCHARLKDDCRRRSQETGGRFPMPADDPADFAESGVRS